MKSLTLLALTGLAANVQAHPARRMAHNHELSKRGVDIDSYLIPELSEYKNNKVTQESDKIMRIASSASSYVESATQLVKTIAPDAEFRVVDDHYVGSNGVAHVNFKQTAHGLDIDNGDFNVNVGKDGKIFSFGNSFFTGELPKESPLTKREFSDPVAALQGAIGTLGLSIDTSDVTAEAKEATEQYLLKGTSGTERDPVAKLVYFIKDDSVALSWRVETDVSSNWLQTYVDATDNESVHGVIDFVSDIATYQVYPWGINDPTEGERKVIEDPWNIATSEFTWQSDGTNYTTTRGNNGVAQNNPSGGNQWENNYRPDSADLDFEYKFTLDQTDATAYKDASITQLFYTANKYHDLLYTLGFTEAAGNFESNNNGQGGAGDDFVILNAQDGSGTNNANFATPPDGGNGQMRMYLWDSSNPVRDCSFEAGVVIHEYTHGLSTRLTGGPANSGCLGGIESGGMGEGWGDFMATAIRLKANDTRATDYPMGAWVANDPAGIRKFPYSTSTTTNPLTYASADDEANVHGVGTVWASTLYEVLWNLIDKYGKEDGDFPTFDADGVPTDGKYLTMKLVVDGMALQPCNPTFITARDAILDADEALTGGANKCEIWTGFAKRGVGEGAKYGASSRTEDMTVPDGVC